MQSEVLTNRKKVCVCICVCGCWEGITLSDRQPSSPVWCRAGMLSVYKAWRPIMTYDLRDKGRGSHILTPLCANE